MQHSDINVFKENSGLNDRGSAALRIKFQYKIDCLSLNVF